MSSVIVLVSGRDECLLFAERYLRILMKCSEYIISFSLVLLKNINSNSLLDVTFLYRFSMSSRVLLSSCSLNEPVMSVLFRDMVIIYGDRIICVVINLGFQFSGMPLKL